jgi:hypothetical protein
MWPHGNSFSGGDFDPTFDATASCSGRWRPQQHNHGHNLLSQHRRHQGTGSLQASLIGKGNGGEYPSRSMVPALRILTSTIPWSQRIKQLG